MTEPQFEALMLLLTDAIQYFINFGLVAFVILIFFIGFLTGLKR